MSQFFSVHPTHPQARLLARAAQIVQRGGVIAYPTDSTYALGCHIGDKAALDRIREIRGLHPRHHFTLMCRDLSELAAYAMVDNTSYRIIKRYTPGPFTFILKATREVPRRLMSRRRTIGLRVPASPVSLGLLAQLREPMMSTTLLLPGDDYPLTEAEDIRERLEGVVDLIMDAGPCLRELTTVVDLTDGLPEVTRVGLGDFQLSPPEPSP